MSGRHRGPGDRPGGRGGPADRHGGRGGPFGVRRPPEDAPVEGRPDPDRASRGRGLPHGREWPPHRPEAQRGLPSDRPPIAPPPPGQPPFAPPPPSQPPFAPPPPAGRPPEDRNLLRERQQRLHPEFGRGRKPTWRQRLALRRERELLERHQRGEHPYGYQPKWWQIAFGMAAFLAGFSILWALAHLIMRIINRLWTMPIAFREYATLLLAFFLFGSTITIARLFFRPERRVIQVMSTIIDAMQRMAKGDFNINVEVHPRFAGEFYAIVQNLNRMAAELGQIEQMRQEFISNVSHEFQSPLTSIKGFTQALQQGQVSEETRKYYLKIIETESERLSRLSDNLLKLTSLESKHHPFQPKPFRLDRQIRLVVLSCEPQWVDKRIEMDISLSETVIDADEELLNQVWINLLGNSIKFTPEGGTIKIELTASDEEARIVFTDSGIGIAAEDLPHLFERFYKADKSRNRTSGGSGLGLSIVHKIVDMHRGGIDVESTPGDGTSFVVTLPRRQPQEEADC
ncbi:cell wall metabolism sensor histidine kinase WalK [Cohnella sp. REN36]|uniref:sensor histidine kinase n=1 Tax=Cohnella sp. REN36 TaxID=2887347 RepID=UPI001D1582EE|nr:HAMP domain-containing sensor histidine kinase [Cohnella sp. REN36]MCC3373093.1 HAMP domain-containing histidine kinase [Cohnella sp. REN36]